MLPLITIVTPTTQQGVLAIIRHSIQGTVVFVVLVLSSELLADEIQLRQSFAGNLSFEVIGGVNRQLSTGWDWWRGYYNICQILPSSSANLSLPAGAKVKTAILYWAGSGSTDNNIRFAGNSVQPDSSAELRERINRSNLTFYNARKDVTHLVNGSGSYSVSNLDFNTSSAYCDPSVAFGGWALVVVYEHSSEPLRVVNLFDGFQKFQNNQIELTPDNFVIGNPADGAKHAHITWEGDAGNSQSQNYSESLTFNGRDLTDRFNPRGNQFNSYSNALMSTTSGLDIDVYDVSSYIASGQTSVTTHYSSGQDLVFLTAEIISVPNKEVADIYFAHLSAQDAFVNGPASISLRLGNNGPSSALANSRISFELPAGMQFNGHSGNQWHCSVAASRVSCVYADAINHQAQSAPLTLRLNTSPAAAGQQSIEFSVSNPRFDNISRNNTQSVSVVVLDRDLSQSSLTVSDLNGGQIEAGDILRYQLTVREANNRSLNNIELSQLFQPEFRYISVLSAPANSIIRINGNDAPLGSRPADYLNATGNQQLEIRNIELAAGDEAQVIIDAVIDEHTPADSRLNHQALLTRAQASQPINAAAHTVVAGFKAETGNKPLYLTADASMSRRLNIDNDQTLLQKSNSVEWQITPALQQDLQLDGAAGGIVAQLHLAHPDNNRNGWLGHLRRAHTISLSLLRNNSQEIAATRVTKILSANRESGLYEFHLPFASVAPGDLQLLAGDQLTLRLSRSLLDDANNRNISDRMALQYQPGLDNSKLILPAMNVIQVEKIQFYNKDFAEPERQEITQARFGQTLFINATVSDPFGSFDISAASLSITDDSGEEIVPATAMSEVQDDQKAHKVYQLKYQTPTDSEKPATLAIRVTAKEGQENEIEHQRQASLEVRQLLPQIKLTKSSLVISDPVNGNQQPKMIPGAVVAYTLQVINSGDQPDANSIVINEEIPAAVAVFVGDLENGSPVHFIDGTSPDSSGLTFNFESLQAANDDIGFSADGGATFSYSPSPDSDGYDGNVTHIRLQPKGIFNAANDSQPQFSFQYKVKVQ